MKQAEHNYLRTFGYIVTKTTYRPDDTLVNSKCNFFDGDTYTITGPYVNNKRFYETKDNCIPWLMVSGKMEITNVDTGAVEIRTGGESNLLTEEPLGTYKGRCLEEAVVYSFWPENNSRCSPIVPLVNYFSLKKDEVSSPEKGIKVFLASGSLEIDEKQYVAPCSILVWSYNNQKTMKALTDCYGFSFA